MSKKAAYIKNLEMPKAPRTRLMEDKFGIGDIKKGEPAFIEAEKKDKLVSLRASINKHKQFWEKQTGNTYSVQWVQVDGKWGFGIWLLEKGKK